MTCDLDHLNDLPGISCARRRHIQAARHSVKAMVLLDVARTLRRAAVSLRVQGYADDDEALRALATRLDARRRRVMKGPGK